jgi:hypothetical protein
MALDRDRLAALLQKTAYAAPMADPMAPAGGASPMDPAMMGGAPPMDPAMMGGAPPMDPAMMGGAPPMDPAMMGGAPPMDPAMAEQLMAAGGGMPAASPMDPAMMGGASPMGPGPAAADVESVGAEQGPGAPEPEPTVSDMTITDLQSLIADTVAATLAEAQGADEMPGQVSDMQDEIAGLKEMGGAIPSDTPSMPAPEMPMEEGFAEEMPPEVAPEMALPKVASENTGVLMDALKKLNTLR